MVVVVVVGGSGNRGECRSRSEGCVGWEGAHEERENFVGGDGGREGGGLCVCVLRRER